ncbi:MAG: hypothetical protein FJX77_01430 [Armatimonadetes bacterium]|nr:hypothetical protein [Armatimonadota bacterium]
MSISRTASISQDLRSGAADPTLGSRPAVSVPLVQHSEPESDLYVTLGDLFEIRRAHWPGNLALPGPTSPTRVGPGACRVVRPDEIGQFRLEGSPCWMEYDAIRSAFAELRRSGSKAHLAPYPRAVVFAPQRLLLAETDRPLRAVVVEESVYPTRGKVVLPRFRWALGLAHVTAALLNSALGLGLYHTLFQLVRRREPRSGDGVADSILARLPLFHVEATEAEVRAAAREAYQLAVLSEASRDGIGPADPLLDSLRLKSLSRLARLQRRSEAAIEELLGKARLWHAADLPGEQTTINRVLQELPPVGDLMLLSLEERVWLREGLAALDQREWSRLARYGELEARLNALDEPRGCLAPPDDKPGEGLAGAPADPAEWRRRLRAMSEAALTDHCRAGPPPVAWAWHQAYRNRQQNGALTDSARDRWVRLLPTIENWNADRFLMMGELAARRGLSLEDVRREFEDGLDDGRTTTSR